MDEPFTIIGIVNDIMQESPFYPVRPHYIISSDYDNMFNLILKLNPQQNAKQSLSKY